jgi:hypothetical protein
MAIDSGFTHKKMVIFHSFLYVYRRVFDANSNWSPFSWRVPEYLTGNSLNGGIQARGKSGCSNW